MIKTFPLLVILPALLWAQGSLLLMGGGSDTGVWADAPFAWFVQQADSGVIINIDVDEVANYDEEFISHGADPASHALRIRAYQANDPAIYNDLISASGIWMEGGDQWDYLSAWKGTLVEDAIHYVFNNGGVIGGTSAGLAVLGQVVFDARIGSAYPDECAYNPYDSHLTMEDDFLQILPGVLTDSHFNPRGRIGRLVPMLARRIQDNGQDDLTAIGVDEQTAMGMYPDKTSLVWGYGAVTILHKTDNSIIHCEANTPLTFTDIHFDMLIRGAEYDLNSHTLINPGPYLLPYGSAPDAGEYQNTVLNGSLEESINQGEIIINRLYTSDSNAWDGRLYTSPGDTIVPRAVIIPRLWYKVNGTRDFYQNLWIGGLMGVASFPRFSAIYLDDGCSPTVSADGILTSDVLTYLVETSDVTHAGFWSTSTDYPGLINARLHFLGDGYQYDLLNQAVVGIRETDSPQTGDTFDLLECYPNPFNPETTIRYTVRANGNASRHITLTIYNSLGQLVTTLVDETQSTGVKVISWDGRSSGGHSQASGIYLVKLAAGNNHITKKLVYLK